MAFFRGHVDQIHVRKCIEVVVVARTARNCYWGTVHVQLAVADTIVPCPGQCHHTIREVFWNSKREGMGLSIAIRIDGTSTFENLNDLEGRVRCWLLVLGDSNLASAATMRSRAYEAQLLRRADGHIVHLCDIVNSRTLLARIIGLGGAWFGVYERGVVESAHTERNR